jgi:hypothetical protein
VPSTLSNCLLNDDGGAIFALLFRIIGSVPGHGRRVQQEGKYRNLEMMELLLALVPVFGHLVMDARS